MIWGYSCSISLSDCDQDKIRDGEYISQVFMDTVRAIKMTPYGKPQMVHFGKDPKVTGWSANLFLEESNMTGHFVEGDNSAHLDVFSCKKFDARELEESLKSAFEAKTVSSVLLLRGKTITHLEI
jgi:S-adenosylmethionine decarboxylase